jgi:adenosylcobinamide-phosphate synthase
MTVELAPLLAFLLDRWPGDPPNRWHPVAWQGRLLTSAAPLAPDGDPARLAYGTAVVAAGAGASAAAAALVAGFAARLPLFPQLLVTAVALKLAVSSHGLDRAAGEVESALRRGDLVEARRLLGWHLVSRPTADLSAEEVAAATVESVAENLTDAFVAPLCAWVLGGLPAVWAYRFVQTSDSMWGYHDPEHEWLGKFAARLDDALNWLPARLAAGLLAVAAGLHGADVRGAWHTRRSEARRTASPNAGQTISTMAGALHVTLSKRGHYTLNGGCEPVTPDTLARARRIVRTASLLGIGMCILLGLSKSFYRRGRA